MVKHHLLCSCDKRKHHLTVTFAVELICCATEIVATRQMKSLSRFRFLFLFFQVLENESLNTKIMSVGDIYCFLHFCHIYINFVYLEPVTINSTDHKCCTVHAGSEKNG